MVYLWFRLSSPLNRVSSPGYCRPLHMSPTQTREQAALTLESHDTNRPQPLHSLAEKIQMTTKGWTDEEYLVCACSETERKEFETSSHTWGSVYELTCRNGCSKAQIPMKTTPVSILLVGIVSTHSALAAPPAREERPEATRPKHNFMDAWKKADQNSDSTLSFNEFSSLPRLQAIAEEKRTELFERLDKDRDNQLTLEEMQRMGPPKTDGPNHRKRLWELDTDKSGSITQDELSAGEMFRKLPPERQEKLFDRLDTNKDGVISPADRPENPGPPPEGERPRNNKPDDKDSPRRPIPFPKLDINSDGLLDFDEFAKMPGISRLDEDDQEKAFEKIDTNKDLKIIPQELENFRPFEHSKGKGPRPNRPQGTPPASLE